MDSAPDLRPWGLPPPDTAATPASGTNNHVQLLTCAGHRFVWRRYQNLRIEQVRREHRLLSGLAEAALPFGVPCPLRTRDGDTLVVDGAGAIELYELIRGRRPEQRGPDIALVAQAFGLLHNALASLPRELAPHDWEGTTLGGVHPGVPDPSQLTDELAAHGATAAQLRWWRSASEADAGCVAAQVGLPTQLIHGDVSLSNALLDDGNHHSGDSSRVSGLLDFEISGWDVRVADLATGLGSCCKAPWTDAGKAQIKVFADAYLQVVAMTDAELAMVPNLVRCRLSGSVVWRAGRARQGLSSWEPVMSHLADAQEHEAHLEAYRLD